MNDATGAADARAQATEADNAAQILDERYRPYSGARHGLAGAMRALVGSSVRFTLGLGRPARHKFLPWWSPWFPQSSSWASPRCSTSI